MNFCHPGQAQVEKIRDTELETTSQVFVNLESASRISRIGLARSKYLVEDFYHLIQPGAQPGFITSRWMFKPIRFQLRR